MRYRFRDLTVDVTTRSVCRGSEVLKLPELSFDALVALIEGAPNSLSLETLARTVWRQDYVSDETIVQRIRLLRKALGDDPKNPTYIQTLRGGGYKLLGEPKEEDSAQELETATLEEPSSPVSRIPLFGAALAVIMAAIWLAFLSPTGSENNNPHLTGERLGNQIYNLSLANLDEANSEMRSLLERDPDDLDARVALSMGLAIQSRVLGQSQNTLAEAEGIARVITQQRPERADAWAALGFAIDPMERPADALAAYEKALELSPDHAVALSGAANVARQRGDLYQALMLEMRSVNTGEYAPFREIQIAQTLELLDYPAAQEWRNDALAKHPDHEPVVVETARYHLRQSDAYAALDAAKNPIFDGKSIAILALVSRAFLYLDDSDNALKLFGKAGLAGSYGVAAIEAQRGDTKAAETFIRRLQGEASRPKAQPHQLVELAEVYAAMGDDAKAIDALSHARDAGWLDHRWLEQSPFLADLMSSEPGQELAQMMRESIEAQRLKVEAEASLKRFAREGLNSL